MIGTSLSNLAAVSSGGIKVDEVVVSGLNMMAARLSPGAISESSSSHLPPREASLRAKPVMFPPGRSSRGTMPHTASFQNCPWLLRKSERAAIGHSRSHSCCARRGVFGGPIAAKRRGTERHRPAVNHHRAALSGTRFATGAETRVGGAPVDARSTTPHHRRARTGKRRPAFAKLGLARPQASAARWVESTSPVVVAPC
jgi:hypothetical protein